VGFCGLLLGKELLFQLKRVFHKIEVQFSNKLFCFGFVHVGFALGSTVILL
jgi:hypothetical protein